MLKLQKDILLLPNGEDLMLTNCDGEPKNVGSNASDEVGLVSW